MEVLSLVGSHMVTSQCLAQPKFPTEPKAAQPPKKFGKPSWVMSQFYATATRRRFPYFYRTLYFLGGFVHPNPNKTGCFHCFSPHKRRHVVSELRRDSGWSFRSKLRKITTRCVRCEALSESRWHHVELEVERPTPWSRCIRQGSLQVNGGKGKRTGPPSIATKCIGK